MTRILFALILGFSTVHCESGDHNSGTTSTDNIEPGATVVPPSDEKLLECWKPSVECNGCKLGCGKDLMCYLEPTWLDAGEGFNGCASGFTLDMCTDDSCVDDYVCYYDLYSACIEAEATKGPCKTTNGCLAIAQRCLLETGCGLEYPPDPEPEFD